MTKAQKPELKGMTKLRRRIHQSLGIAFGGHLIRDHNVSKTKKIEGNHQMRHLSGIKFEIIQRIKFLIFVLKNFKEMHQISQIKTSNGRRSMQTKYRTNLDHNEINTRAIDQILSRLNSDLINSNCEIEELKLKKNSVIGDITLQIVTSAEELKILDSIPGLDFKRYLTLLKECLFNKSFIKISRYEVNCLSKITKAHQRPCSMLLKLRNLRESQYTSESMSRKQHIVEEYRQIFGSQL